MTLLSFFSLTLALLVAPLARAEQLKSDKCIQIFYDRSPDSKYSMGRTYSIMLQNLLAHFPKYQQIEGAIEDYQAGDLDRCQASFYIASYFENTIPVAFFKDYESTSRSVVWMGYSIWKPGLEYFDRIFGYQFQNLTTLNTKIRDGKGRPTFFKYATYHGEQFRKFGDYSRSDPSLFLAAFESVRLKKTRPSETQLISELIDNGSGEKIPYILRNRNHFYIADVPFSYMHEADRFLIVADLLFDVLGEEALHAEKIAFLRIEDVFPMIALPFSYDALDVLRETKVPANISLVPFFADPLNVFLTKDRFLAMNQVPAFMQLIDQIKNEGGSFIWHGVTHQYESMKNPHSALSTDDFEFWDSIQNQPVLKDSPSWVLRRMEDGLSVLQSSHVEPLAWLTPHYQASVLDYLIFARVFDWNVGRVVYSDFLATGLPSAAEDILMASPTAHLSQRLAAFQNLKVQALGPWNGQMFPYLIFGDIYGQRLVPENLGNSQPYLSEYVLWPRTVDDILEDARRNLVLRDTWASLFYHPALLDTVTQGGRGLFPGDSADLRKLIHGVQSLGYRFVSMEEIKRRWSRPVRPETLTIKKTR